MLRPPRPRCRSKRLNRIFLDANAGVPLRAEAREAWLRAESEAPANPAALHRSGRRAQAVLEDARDEVAALLGCTPREVLFTSGATEANNLALLGAARALHRMEGRWPWLLASAAEHPAVLAPLRLLQQEGATLKLAPVDAHARAEATQLKAWAEDAPASVTALQWANNETGAVQDLAAVLPAGDSAAHVHVDAVQGFGKLPWNDALGMASTFAVSGHKLGGPKGIGALRVAETALLDPVLVGGGHQGGRRAGTEAPALAAAFATALRLAMEEQDAWARRTRAAVETFLATLRGLGVEAHPNHPPAPEDRLPNTLSLSFAGVDGRALLPACDAEGLDVSSGAACSSGAARPSAVLLACGLGEERARATLRISFPGDALEEEAAEAARRLARVVERAVRSC